MIRARRNAEKKVERYDLFSQLLDASEEETENGMPQITDRDLVGAFRRTSFSALVTQRFIRPDFVVLRQHIYISPCGESIRFPTLILARTYHSPCC